MTGDREGSPESEQERLRDRRAAEAAADPDRLLPGEDEATGDADDCRVWVDVYSELLDYKRALLDVTEEKLAGMTDKPARREVVETDNVVIGEEVKRFERRLVYWTARLREADPRPDRGGA
jgi:hypothetical protein